MIIFTIVDISRITDSHYMFEKDIPYTEIGREHTNKINEIWSWLQKNLKFDDWTYDPRKRDILIFKNKKDAMFLKLLFHGYLLNFRR